jgi:WD40 repeat protein
VRLWDLATGKPIRVLEGHTERVTALALSSDGSLLASAGHDGAIRLWEMNRDREPIVLQGPPGRIHSIAISPTAVVLAEQAALAGV